MHQDTKIKKNTKKKKISTEKIKIGKKQFHKDIFLLFVWKFSFRVSFVVCYNKSLSKLDNTSKPERKVVLI